MFIDLVRDSGCILHRHSIYIHTAIVKVFPSRTWDIDVFGHNYPAGSKRCINLQGSRYERASTHNGVIYNSHLLDFDAILEDLRVEHLWAAGSLNHRNLVGSILPLGRMATEWYFRCKFCTISSSSLPEP
jgi:hypothetical protein